MLQRQRIVRPSQVVLCAAAVLCIAAGTLRAQEPSFTAGTNRTDVPLGEQFQVTFTLSGGQVNGLKDFRQPNLNKDFLTLNGPSTSQQVSIINGRMSSSISWTYVLQARAVGAFTVPPATVIIDGRTLATNPIAIRILNAAPKPGAGKTGAVDEKQATVITKFVFVRAISDKRTVWLGEPVSVTFKLYSRIPFNLSAPFKLPRMVGFWAEDIETPTQLRPVIETFEGRQYETYMLRKVLYFPTQSGKLSISPFEIPISAKVRQKRATGDEFFDRFFSDPFFDSFKNIDVTLTTQNLDIDVRALPEAGKPASFRGAVGNYTMETTVDRTKLRTNETATLRIKLRGEGNLTLLEGPQVMFPDGLDHYDPTVTDDIVRGTGRISGLKNFDYVLVPRYAGDLALPPVEFSYFDPERARYVTLKSDPRVFHVTEAPGQAARAADQSRVDYLAQDVRPLRRSPGTLRPVGEIGVSAGTAALLYLLPALVAAAGIAWKRRYDRIHGDVAGLRMRRATRIAEKHLAASRRFIEKGMIDAYYLEIARALWGYVQNKLRLPTSAMSMATVEETLRTRGVETSVTTGLLLALGAVDEARFSPTRFNDADVRALYDHAKNAIVSMEQGLRGDA